MHTMDETHASSASGQTKNPLSYTLIALGILLLAMGVPVIFATSQITRLLGEAGQNTTMIVVGILIVLTGAATLAIGLRKR